MEVDKKKSVVYTVVTDGYDSVKPIAKPNDNVDYFLVSNKSIPEVAGWKVIVINSRLKHTKFNRKFKINPDLLFPNYKESLYIDGNIEIIGEVEDFMLSIPNDVLMALFDHPVHLTAKQEFDAIIRMGYGSEKEAIEQFKEYESFYSAQKQFYECNIIYRKHNEIEVIAAMRTWWSEFLSGIPRDQLSMHYSCSKFIDIYPLGRHDARFIHKYFKYSKHRKLFNRSLILKHRIFNNIKRVMRKING
ncbi:putative DUF616 domain-containing protein [Vibrio crassostreae]|nr:putative DUF616 domain-containing protein [Vibrio crassostreae]CAK3200026.1 putative DUF616 domain-containing protein [Vibrio crassostreae]CAK3236789.1 putative DUF616 domain-containing protein [Vibrio crassostreae]CAK3237416.1 putative DUF616 domain-containing protein [Vibrio crassostreae]CAK3304399.1 putative DUF616 domain-containing protein [Vibrio crassostreae]